MTRKEEHGILMGRRTTVEGEVQNYRKEIDDLTKQLADTQGSGDALKDVGQKVKIAADLVFNGLALVDALNQEGGLQEGIDDMESNDSSLNLIIQKLIQ